MRLAARIVHVITAVIRAAGNPFLPSGPTSRRTSWPGVSTLMSRGSRASTDSAASQFRLPTLLIFLSAIPLAMASSLSAQGLIFLSPEAYESIPAASAPQRKAPLPSEVDLSQYLPPARDQGPQGSCVGWAIAYGLKTYQESVELRRRPTRPEHAFSPAYVYNAIARGGCGQGSQIWDALAFVEDRGVAPWTAFPYDSRSCTRTPDRQTIEMARDYRISSSRRVDTHQTAIKSQLANGFPVVIGMYVGTEFTNHGTGVFHGDSQTEGGHAMLVVGYDDGLRAYKVFNSWGQAWGENGYGWISYRTFERQVGEAYVAQDAPTPRTDNTSNPPPAPVSPRRERVDIPTPRPTNRVSAVLEAPIIAFDRPVQSPFGVEPGMSIRVPGQIQNAGGRTAQVVVRFAFRRNGAPLRANPEEYEYRDNMGVVATGTSVFALTPGTVRLGRRQMTIPYYALNFRSANYRMQYDLVAKATLYVNNFAIAESQPAALTVHW